MLQITALLALVFAIVIAVFAVQNTQQVPISFLAWQAQGVVVSVLVLVSAALGAGAMLLLGLAREIGQQLRMRSLNHQLRQAQTRVKQLEDAAAASAQPATSLALPADSAAASTVPLPGITAATDGT